MSDEKISKALQINMDEKTMSDVMPEILNKKEVIKKIKVEKEEALTQDFDHARDNLRELISNGKEAMDGIMKVAIETDSPRAYEVASLMIKTLSDLNKDLIVLHEKTASVKKEKVTNITNNSIYVGSTTDLQNLINTERSLTKNEDAGDVNARE
jgi:hypothetical protein